MKTRALVFAIVVCACNHDYDALKGRGAAGSGGNGAGGTAATGGRGGGVGAGGSVAGGSGSDGVAGTTGVAGVGNATGSAGRGGSGGIGNTGGVGNASGTGGSVGCGACPTGATCNNGTCVCAPGLLLCGQACVASDSSHCGSCTRVCDGTTVCTAGMCVGDCTSGQMKCPDGACIPPGGDGTILRCGGCNACPAGATCTNNSCVCPTAGQMLCGSACVDTKTSNTHCGGCNRPCSGTCTNGTCTTATACGSAYEVAADGFVKMPAAGGKCWHGYAFAGADAGSMISPRDFSACGSPCTLRISGTVGPATAANSYAGVAYLGFNVGQDAGSTTVPTVTPTGTGLTVTVSASTGALPVRVQLTGTGATFWCYTLTGASPVTIPYAMFNTACWDGSGTAYAKQPITSIELVVPGGMNAASGVSVALTSVREN